MAEQQTEKRTLTDSERRKNVMRVETAEERIGYIEQRVVHLAATLASTVRELHALRGELRAALGRDPLPPLAPLFQCPDQDTDNGDDDGEADGDATD